MKKWQRIKQLTEAGKIGGKNRAKKLSPERRSEIARMGGIAKRVKAEERANFIVSSTDLLSTRFD